MDVGALCRGRETQRCTELRLAAWVKEAGKEAVEGDDSSGLKGAAVAWCSARS